MSTQTAKKLTRFILQADSINCNSGSQSSISILNLHQVAFLRKGSWSTGMTPPSHDLLRKKVNKETRKVEAPGSIPGESIKNSFLVELFAHRSEEKGRMEKELDEFVKLARKTLAECPWANLQDVKSYVKQLTSEADEVKTAVANNDHENLKEELGDLFWDTLMVMLIAEKEGLFKPSESLAALIEKMRRRKPFLFTGQKVTLEEAESMWSEAKAKEKMRR